MHNSIAKSATTALPNLLNRVAFFIDPVFSLSILCSDFKPFILSTLSRTFTEAIIRLTIYIRIKVITFFYKEVL